MELRLIGNDLLFDREKVARLFDISATERQRFEEAIEKANSYDEKINEAYERGKDENDKSS
jgi:ArsR family metal-binding transcriptional regulator